MSAFSLDILSPWNIGKPVRVLVETGTHTSPGNNLLHRAHVVLKDARGGYITMWPNAEDLRKLSALFLGAADVLETAAIPASAPAPTQMSWLEDLARHQNPHAVGFAAPASSDPAPVVWPNATCGGQS